MLKEACRSTPSDREFDHRRRLLHNEIEQSLRKDRESQRSERANELEAAAASVSCRKLFQFIQPNGSKNSGVSETICEDDGTRITNVVLDDGQFDWFAAPTTSIRLPCPPWPVTTDPPNEAEV
ncbi:unnamed protein product, partial [Schistosoma mattheei]